MEENKVVIPKEHYQIINFKKEDLPAIGVINISLINFEPKEVFSWHCSLILNFDDLIENGMPTKEQVLKADKFEDFLDDKIKGKNKEKPNALFLGRITWNATRQLLWRIYDPDPVSQFLKNIIHNEEYPLEFDYNISFDEEWEYPKWYLESCKENI
ncbi:DUF695 domain-containing protein [Salegentibacter sp. JZCK2]|uniref:DUF695 domain-containing protein n=1 Tax=Salegentibacter tibetensis TaxID=2873600 RepID=UPI001CCFA432|nr:DUF695 domain-containing protein [Salegentibacter tibetensis]MBZ9731321.1 DUF695 domain-containing protein [Salegentibacter tibetensis]